MALNVKSKYDRTNIFIIDDKLWAWAAYRAKLLGYNSASEYLFDLIDLDKKEDFEKSLKAIQMEKAKT